METKQAATPSVIDMKAGGGVSRSTFNACNCHVFVIFMTLKLHNAHVFMGVLGGDSVQPYFLISYFYN